MMFNQRSIFHFDKLFDQMNRKVGSYIIYQVGDLCCEPGYRVGTHVQVAYEISFIVSGEGSFFVDGKEYKVSEGTLFLNKIGEAHRIRSSMLDPLRFFYLGFNFDLGKCNEQTLVIKEFFDHMGNRVLYDARDIGDMFVKLFTEFITGDAFSDRLLENYIDQMLIHIYRRFTERKQHTYTIDEDDVKKKLVYDIVHYIDNEIENIEDLAGLSNKFGYSYSHISQTFNDYTGESLRSYYTKRRFEKAKEYIQKGMSITQIAERLGYKSIHAFSRAFHSYVGMPPSEYKRCAEENNELMENEP